MVAMTHMGDRISPMRTTQDADEISVNMSENQEKKYIRPEKPEDLLTCSSYIARDLVAQYLQLGALNQTDAVALYIVAGVVEFGRQGKRFHEHRGGVARALGLPKKGVNTYIKRLIREKVISRDAVDADRSRKRAWSVPGLKPPKDPSAVSSVLNSTLDSESLSGRDNPYPEGNTTCTRGAETSCSPGEGTRCALHLRESEEKESEEEKHKGKERPGTPSLVSRDSSSFKKRSKAETRSFLDSFPWERFQLDSPEGLASCWAHLVGLWKSPGEAEAISPEISAAEIDPMEVSRAYMTLKQMRIYKAPETVRRWLEWFVKSGGLSKTTFITKFSKSWDDYVPIVAKAYAAKMIEEENAWVAELNARYESEKGKTMPILQFHIGLGEDDSQRLRKSFLASLPEVDAIRDAVFAVPLDADLNDDGEYVRWLDTVAKAVPVLGPYNDIPDSKWQLDLVRLAREDFRGDMESFAEATREYVVGMMEHFLRWIEEGELVSPRINSFYWRYYAEYFNLAPGIEDAQRSLRDAEDETPSSG